MSSPPPIGLDWPWCSRACGIFCIEKQWSAFRAPVFRERVGEGGGLPNAAKAVGVEDSFFTDDGEIFGLGLRDEHAIKGVAVGAGKKTGAEGVLDRNGKQLKALAIETAGEVRRQTPCSRNFPETNLSATFPTRTF